MMDDKPLQTPTSFTEDATTPEIFADLAVGFHILNGVVKVSLGSVRHGTSAPSAKRVIVGRVVTSVPAAQSLAIGLLKFLRSQGIDVAEAPASPKATKTRKVTKAN
jgi:hypothetical protein